VPTTVSVVIPAHHMGATLDDTVRSAVTQEAVSDIVIVIDGDDPATLAVATSWADSTDGVQLIRHHEARGPAAARNAGLAKATGTWVVFLDGDDVLLPGGIATLLAEAEDGDVAVCGRFVPVDDAGQPVDIGTWAVDQLRPVVRRRGRVVPSPRGLDDEALLSRLVVPPPSGVLVRRDAATVVHGYDPAYRRSEDIGFLMDLTTVGRVRGVATAVVQYRRAPGQRSQAARSRRRGRQVALLRMIRRGPTAAAVWRRARGAAAHHLDRAQRRWQYSERHVSDLVGMARSTALAVLFRIAGALIAAGRLLGLPAPTHAVEKLRTND
jgi:mycofactocin glycosyltransferase